MLNERVCVVQDPVRACRCRPLLVRQWPVTFFPDFGFSYFLTTHFNSYNIRAYIQIKLTNSYFLNKWMNE